jgi:hypothetical protein
MNLLGSVLKMSAYVKGYGLILVIPLAQIRSYSEYFFRYIAEAHSATLLQIPAIMSQITQESTLVDKFQ